MRREGRGRPQKNRSAGYRVTYPLPNNPFSRPTVSQELRESTVNRRHAPTVGCETVSIVAISHGDFRLGTGGGKEAPIEMTCYAAIENVSKAVVIGCAIFPCYVSVVRVIFRTRYCLENEGMSIEVRNPRIGDVNGHGPLKLLLPVCMQRSSLPVKLGGIQLTQGRLRQIGLEVAGLGHMPFFDSGKAIEGGTVEDQSEYPSLTGSANL